MTDDRSEDWQFQRSCCSAVAVVGLVSQHQPWQQMTQSLWRPYTTLSIWLYEWELEFWRMSSNGRNECKKTLNEPKSEHLCSALSPSPRGGLQNDFYWLFGRRVFWYKVKTKTGWQVNEVKTGIMVRNCWISSQSKRFTVGLYDWLQELHSLNRIKHLYFRNVWRISVNPFNTLQALLSRDRACDARRSWEGFLGWKRIVHWMIQWTNHLTCWWWDGSMSAVRGNRQSSALGTSATLTSPSLSCSVQKYKQWGNKWKIWWLVFYLVSVWWPN